jgi:hypothetical protein
MAKKLLISMLIGTIVYLLIGWFTFDFILGEFSEKNTTQLEGFKKSAEEFSFTWLAVSCAAYAALLSLILIYLADIKSVVKGGVVAAIAGGLIAVMTDSYWYGSSYFYTSIYALVADVIGAIISVGLTGATMVLAGKYIR